MEKYARFRLLLWLLLVTLALTGCSSSDDDVSDGHPDGDAFTDGDDSPDGDDDPPADGDTDGDGETEADSDTDGDFDMEPEENPDGLPDALAIAYSREDPDEPVSDAEIQAFTRKIMAFLKRIHYFDFVLYTTHGVDASTGMRDWQFWYNEHFRKDGDLVTFYHPENLNDGGHNLHIPTSRLLGNLLAASLITEDDTATLAAVQLCKGVSASMLGMVHDENDTLLHLMTRNVVPALNHEFTTHDGKRKAVDYSGWFSPYSRWNCYRYKIEENPYWGEMWVTNLRSKDDVPHIFRLIPNLRYAVSRSENEDLKDFCGETLDLLEAFAKDIVDSDFRIRTKDENGDIMIPGYTDDEDLNDLQGDLASFIDYREWIPEGECNARRGAELIGYHEATIEDCGRGEPNAYDIASFNINRYNKRICRYFHLAHVANALVNRDDTAAAELMDGLEERMDMEKSTTEDEMRYEPDDWYRNLALYYTQSYSFGYPLLSEEVRAIHHYYEKAVDEYDAWPYFDPWAENVPEGDLGAYHPGNCRTEDDVQSCWWRIEDMGQIFEGCWSPFVNPTSARWVDCDIVRDPSKWEED